MITNKQIAKVALGKLKVHLKNGFKTTETAWCSRQEAQLVLNNILTLNGKYDVKVTAIFWNNQKVENLEFAA
jgi:hypothetical protein